MAGQILSLSIFIILLAFFLVLNTQAQFDEGRSGPILESLERTFASKFEAADQTKPASVPDVTSGRGDGDSYERIEALFRSRIPSATARRSSRTGVLIVTVPFADLESLIVADENSGPVSDNNNSAQNKELILSAINILDHDDPARKLQMDIILNLDYHPQKIGGPYTRNDTEKESPLRKISKIAERFEEKGMPVNLLNIGLQKGKKETVDIIFRPYKPYLENI